MPKASKEPREYYCSICGLHYRSRHWAALCHGWCSTHDSCNLKVARHSIEAMEARNQR